MYHIVMDGFVSLLAVKGLVECPISPWQRVVIICFPIAYSFPIMLLEPPNVGEIVTFDTPQLIMPRI
jgi:hypothetical protein